MMYHDLLTLADKYAKTKAQINVIMGGNRTITKGMREIDAALQLARKYPKVFTANQISMFEVKFTINQ